MTRWRSLLALAAGMLAVAGSHGQTIGGRALAIVPQSAAATSEWGTIVDRMVRGDELRVRLERADTLIAGHSVQQLSQYYKGLRVWGGTVARQFDGGSLVSVFGTVYQGLDQFDLDVAAPLGRDAARDGLEALGTLLLPDTDPELVVLPREDGFSLAWTGEVLTRRDIVRLFLDASSGQIVRRYSVKQGQAANAAIGHGTGVLGDDKKMSATAASGTFLASDPLRPPAIATYDMRGNVTRSINVLINRIALVASDVASNTSNNWTDAAVVDAHAYAAYTYDYYFKRFGRRGLDNANHKLTNMVHLVKRDDIFSAPDDILDFYLNAFYCGDCAGGVMVYGEGLPGGVRLTNGQRFDFFSGALDIVAHELTHGVTDFSSRLEYVNESGALNEAFSDMMGTSVEFFFQPPGNGPMQADYLIGEDIVVGVLTGVPNGVRSMANPALYGQPDHYSRRVRLPPDDAHDNGGVHTNSGIPNHAFYLAIEGGTNRTSGIRVTGVGGANRDQIEKIFYRGFTQLMPSNADFSMARAITLRAAQDLYGINSGPYNAVRDAWTAVGVN